MAGEKKNFKQQITDYSNDPACRISTGFAGTMLIGGNGLLLALYLLNMYLDMQNDAVNHDADMFWLVAFIAYNVVILPATSCASIPLTRWGVSKCSDASAAVNTAKEEETLSPTDNGTGYGATDPNAPKSTDATNTLSPSSVPSGP